MVEPPPIIEKYYGHDSSLNVPPKLCLMGCVFCIIGFDIDVRFSLTPKAKETIENRIRKYGGEVESVYSQKCTHVLCESQHHPVFQRALQENKRCVNIYWLDEVIQEQKLKPPSKASHLPKAAMHYLHHPCSRDVYS